MRHPDQFVVKDLPLPANRLFIPVDFTGLELDQARNCAYQAPLAAAVSALEQQQFTRVQGEAQVFKKASLTPEQRQGVCR